MCRIFYERVAVSTRVRWLFSVVGRFFHKNQSVVAVIELKTIPCFRSLHLRSCYSEAILDSKTNVLQMQAWQLVCIDREIRKEVGKDCR